ncbi:hypothetical protein DZF79_02925 [Vibrio parahaemolyticus]|nr:hypothetical protein [Vibrio parahaemolyticus]
MKPENYYEGNPQGVHKRNRHQARDAKSHTHHWCGRCDRSIISNGEKCKSCGYQNKDTFKRTDKRRQIAS